MTRLKLIYTDLMFAFICLIAYSTGGFQKNMLLMIILVTLILGGCVIRHIYYYKKTGLIY